MMMKCSLKKFGVVVFGVVFASVCNNVFADEWEKPWSSVMGAAAQRCTKTFENFQLQAVCMENEKRGYDKMQGDFGMPSTVARKAKERCERTFENFQLQAVCMENEKRGYDKMQELAQPPAEEKARRQEEQVQQQAEEVRARNCEIARRNVEILQSDRPVIKTDAQGKRVTIDAKQRAVELQRALKDQDYFCEL